MPPDVCRSSGPGPRSRRCLQLEISVCPDFVTRKILFVVRPFGVSRFAFRVSQHKQPNFETMVYRVIRWIFGSNELTSCDAKMSSFGAEFAGSFVRWLASRSRPIFRAITRLRPKPMAAHTNEDTQTHRQTDRQTHPRSLVIRTRVTL